MTPSVCVCVCSFVAVTNERDCDRSERESSSFVDWAEAVEENGTRFAYCFLSRVERFVPVQFKCQSCFVVISLLLFGGKSCAADAAAGRKTPEKSVAKCKVQ